MKLPEPAAPAPKQLPSAVAAALIGDFRNFLHIVWKHLHLPDPTPIQYDIAHNIQHGPKRLIIEAFRGVGKSWITSAFVCWLLLVDPQLKILVVSASKQRADDFSIFTKRLIAEMPVLAHLRPREGQRDSNIAFDVGPARAAHAPSVKSLGITGQLTGSRADVIVADDIEVPNNSATQAMREKLANSVKEFEALLTPKESSRIIFLGTPQTEMSVYNELASRGYTAMIWPARYPDAERVEKYGSKLASYIAERLYDGRGVPGKTTDPKRFSDLDLLERELSYGRAGFSLQFMLDTSLSDAEKFPLKLADLVVMDVAADVGPINLAWASSPELVLDDLPMVGLNGDRYLRPMWVHKDMAPWGGTAMAVDPAGRGGDELAYAVGHILHSRVFIPRGGWGGLPGGYSDENLNRLVRIAAQHKVKFIVVEKNFGDGMFTTLLKAALKAGNYPCTVEEVHHNVQKERRICDTLEPVMNQHRLVMDRQLVVDDFRSTETQEKRGFYQLSRMTREKGALKFDDRVDVLAMLLAYWGERLGQDTQSAEDAFREEALLNDLASFEDHVFGRRPRSDSWTDPFFGDYDAND
jgi:hypothetical protein